MKYEFNCNYLTNIDEIDENNEYNKDTLDLLLDLDNIKAPKLKSNTYLDLKYSIVPNWRIKNPDKSIILDKNIILESIIPDKNAEKNILDNILNANKINEFIPEYSFDNNFVNVLNELESYGIIFDMKFSHDYIIKIKPDEVIFPICCVGKNRSQYLFYYLKNLQALYPNYFEVGYPSSGDELSVLNDENSTKSNKNILSSFSVQYKKDNFSSSIAKSFGIIDLNMNIINVSRSIHIFDKVLKKKESYNDFDVKNYEDYKYKEQIYDIFDKSETNKDYEKIKKLFIKYFLTPSNLIHLINSNIPTKIKNITYICLSDKSFFNLCMCIFHIKKTNPEIQFDCVRIIYFGIDDIFQKSNIKDKTLFDYKNKFVNSFQFVI